jgi:Nif-specific regulatory protein
MVHLSPDETARLGRNGDSTLRLRDERASRIHAEVFFARGGWQVRNLSTTNATRLDGERVREVAPLRDGQVIEIGATRLRFNLDPFRESTPAAAGESRVVAVPPVVSGWDRLNTDELNVIFRFISASYSETTPHGLVTLALRTVREQTRAAVCGFLGFDTDDSQLKVLEPAEAEVNVNLSLQLTLKVRSGGCSVWLHGPEAEDDVIKSVSLAAFQDAVCVPLRRPAAEPAAVDPRPTGPTANGTGQAAEPLGALHAYHQVRHFSEPEIRFCEVLAGCLANALHALRSRRALEADNSRLRVHAGRGGDELIGNSRVIKQLRGDVACLAVCPVNVVIGGESGVGKELVALGLHRLSQRREGPLVTVNCAALSTTVAEAELFGHEKGAFTGADRARPGLFQQADEGTLFLDEIGDLTLESQARLLRVLETKKVRALLSDKEIPVDVRIIAATNRDLEKDVRAGRFRRDLYFRLGARLHVAPLRDHAEDVPALAAHFLDKLNQEYRRHVQLSPEAAERLQAYTWPGNVRQLRSVLETAVAMSRSDVLRPADLRLGDEAGEPAAAPQVFNLEEVEARTIRAALAHTNGVLVQAARLLGIHRQTLGDKMKKYGLSAPSDAGEGLPN